MKSFVVLSVFLLSASAASAQTQMEKVVFACGSATEKIAEEMQAKLRAERPRDSISVSLFNTSLFPDDCRGLHPMMRGEPDKREYVYGGDYVALLLKKQPLTLGYFVLIQIKKKQKGGFWLKEDIDRLIRIVYDQKANSLVSVDFAMTVKEWDAVGADGQVVRFCGCPGQKVWNQDSLFDAYDSARAKMLGPIEEGL